MAGGIEIGQVVNVRGELAAIDAVKLADEGAEIGARRPDLFARRIDFGAIAGGEHDRLVGRAAGRPAPAAPPPRVPGSRPAHAGRRARCGD